MNDLCLATAVLFFVGGMAVPLRYGLRRLRGFGRYVASKLPFKEKTEYEN